ncbi:potassium/proton antiporter [Pelagibacterium luteolum]|uniref:Cell volume regulation protein A n=1 Tax=Pelagibacterium luteolum TaxID=440168 RepID=A0A1G7WQ36_9HYPH|nr:potassium/proton antiporter [Pelagibacterium luteolum]SDG73998.1 cell volume regulation protein A [Pelagibacterium luteolum]
MIDWIYPLLLVGAGLIVVSVFTSFIAFRFGAPLLLIFLGIGLAAGTDGLGIEFSDYNMAYFAGSLALAVILFDSGFGTPLKSFRQAAAPSIVLATVGVLLTTAIVGMVARLVFGFGWIEALLMGAIVSSTDAAAVFFLLRVGGITIRDKVRSTLEVESGSNDPMAIFLTIMFVELLVSGASLSGLTSQFLAGFGLQMGLGLALGLLGGAAMVFIINRVTLEGALYPIIVLSMAVLLFAFTGLLGGSGALAAYVAGLVAGNRKVRGRDTLAKFQDGMTWLAQIAMFLILGLLAYPSQFGAVALPALALALVLMFVARPVAVWLCLLPFHYARDEIAFISWVGLRGAVSILLAILPLIAQLENGEALFNTAFIIVLTSLLIQGWTIKPMAQWLGLIVPPRIGPVERVGLELPGNAHHELIVYHVVEGSPVAEGERLPRWARPSLIVRDGHSMRYQYAGRIRPGDYIYMFISPRYTRLLDRLFASPTKVEADDKDFFGEFKINPERPLSALRDAYDAPIGPNISLDKTIAEYMRERLGGGAEQGDRVAIGPLELIVHDADVDGNVTAAGLAIDHDEPKPRVPLFVNGRELLHLVRRRIAMARHRRQTRPEPVQETQVTEDQVAVADQTPSESKTA